MKESKLEKARRLHRNNKVQRTQAWIVEGDTDTYILTWIGSELVCTCPTQDVECSHMISVALSEV